MHTQKQHAIFGEGCHRTLGAHLNSVNCTRLLIVAGRHVVKDSFILSSILANFKNEEVEIFSDVSANPKIADASLGASTYKRFRPTLMIAIGGGSIIDIAKLVRAMGAQNADPTAIATGIVPLKNVGCPLVAIPTTAGTGSEATHFAVVYVGRKKYSLAHDSILPNYAVIDPELTYSLPPKETAYGGLDALCQAIESYWALCATSESQRYSASAMSLAWQNLEAAVGSPEPKVRANMANAANLSGRAINISKTTAAHALSYYLTTQHGVPHGHAVALTLGAFFDLNDGCNVRHFTNEDSRFDANKRMQNIYRILQISPPTAESARTAFYNLLKNLGLATRLRDVGVQNSELRNLVESVNVERLENNPATLNGDALYELLEKRF